MVTDGDAIDRLQTTALMVRMACRHDTSLRFDALASPSLRAVARGMCELHDASVQTVLLRAGLQLGIIKPTGHA